MAGLVAGVVAAAVAVFGRQRGAARAVPGLGRNPAEIENGIAALAAWLVAALAAVVAAGAILRLY